jgi:hypothetical protein
MFKSLIINKTWLQYTTIGSFIPKIVKGEFKSSNLFIFNTPILNIRTNGSFNFGSYRLVLVLGVQGAQKAIQA